MAMVDKSVQNYLRDSQRHTPPLLTPNSKPPQKTQKQQQRHPTGANAIGVWRGMKKASEVLVQKIRALARPVSSGEDLHNIATIASGSPIMVRARVTGLLGSFVGLCLGGFG